MPNIRRERERSVFIYSPGRTIGREVLRELEERLKGPLLTGC